MIRLFNLAWRVGLSKFVNLLLYSYRSFKLTVTYLFKYLGHVFTCVNIESFSYIVLWQLVFKGQM